jgi:hypothetical protein
LCETSFDNLLKRWDHAGVVGAYAHLETIDERCVSQDGKVVVGESTNKAFGNLNYSMAFLIRCESHPRGNASTSGFVTLVSTENEVDARKKIASPQFVYNLNTVRCKEATRLASSVAVSSGIALSGPQELDQ